MRTRAAETIGGVLTDRALAYAFLFLGWTLIYLVMIDQGAIIDALLSGDGSTFFHELFHDGRHISAFPCH